MIVAVTFALYAEFAPWRRRRSFGRCADGRELTYATRVGNVDVRVTFTGVGPRAATVAAARTVFRDRPDVCIASGLAGGLDEALRVGEIVASGSVRSHDQRSVHIDPRLLALAVSGGARSVPLYTSPTIVVGAAQKRCLSGFASAVDMESAVILSESVRRRIPCVAIRAISDRSTVDLPFDLNQALTERGSISPAPVVAALLRRPHAVWRLIRFGLDGRRALTALAAFLDRYIEELGASPVIAKTLNPEMR